MATVNSLTLRLEVLPAVDQDLDAIDGYRFLLHSGKDLQIPYADSNQSGTVSGTVWDDLSVSLDNNEVYYWRAIATDEQGASSDAASLLHSSTTTASSQYRSDRSSGT